jgi:ATP-binding cassette subfamily C protein EexD
LWFTKLTTLVTEDSSKLLIAKQLKQNTNLLRRWLFTAEVKKALGYMVVLGFAINLLLLVSPLYMLQMYDRVLTSRSEETLLALSVIVLFLLAGFGFLEVIRSHMMVGVSVEVDRRFNHEVFTSLFREVLQKGQAIGGQPLRDLETLRGMISGRGIIALFDLPWAPFFIAIIFVMHPLLGGVALFGAVVTLILAVLSERSSRPLMSDASEQQMKASRFVDACLSNVDAISSMGMLQNIRRRWLNAYTQSVDAGSATAELVSSYSGSTKAFRMVLQSAMLGTGGWLALQDEVSPGVMVAASIIFGKALGPLEQSIAASRGLLAARAAMQRLEVLLSRHENTQEPMPLPEPTGAIQVKELALAVAGRSEPLLQGVAFELNVGQVLAIVGPSASGKSSLARALLGLWQPARGSIRMDGAELSQWDQGILGQYLGYLPQDVELLSGTVQENIARFSEDADASSVVEASTRAGCHQMVLNLLNGYDTPVGASGHNLSGGQSQRVALARCFYGDPVFVVLDEPDSNLDVEGVVALDRAIAELKARKTTLVLITHNTRLLRHADKAMMLVGGKMAYLGTPQELMEKLAQQAAP